jgi:dTMP kinase
MIAVEGADKAGKHTQVMKIMDYLQKQNIACETLDFPQYGAFFGKVVKNYLNGSYGGIHDLPSEYSMLPYALDRLQHQKIIKEWLDSGKWVILDRYSYSNLYSVAKHPESEWDSKIQYLEEMEFSQLGILRPNYNIYLYLDPKIAYDMRAAGLKSYQNGRPDIHESNFKLLRDVSKCYRLVAQRDPSHWMIVDEMESGKRLTIDEVFERIKPKLDEFIVKSKTRQQ